MTAAKSSRRPRRSNTAAALIPPSIAAWFAGERASPPLEALAPPGNVLIYERWQAWLETHPGAIPPSGHAYIARPPPARVHGTAWAEALAVARTDYRRGLKLGIYGQRA